jgi:hypothetical protein
MSESEQDSPRGEERAERWLGSGRAARSRRWAYPELLLGVGEEHAGEELSALAADLAVDLAELRRLQNELYDQVVRVAALEGRIQALLDGAGAGAVPTPAEPVRERRATVTLPSFPSSSGSEELHDHAGLLARCEGFEVHSPFGLVGLVEGTQFGSRIDTPDFLEVRGGRLGRELLLIPVEAVQEISHEEGRLLVHGVSPTQTDIPHELVDRLRKALHVMNTTIR